MPGKDFECREGAHRQDAGKNAEIQALIMAIGAGVSEDFDVDKAR